MYDIKPLEEEWKQYQKKKKKPLYILALAFLLLSICLFLLYKYKNIDLPSFSSVVDINNNRSTKKEKNQVLIDMPLNTLQIHKKEVIVDSKPTIHATITSGVTENLMPTLPIVDNIPILDNNPIAGNIVVTDKPKQLPRQRVIPDKPRKKMHLNIIKSSTVSAYKDVEKRFYQSHDTDDSLFLAKSYYRKGNYKKSEYWALQTNKINSNIEESWIIFVKSKVKLGQKNQAIHLLTNYAKKSNSAAAWNLLLQLKK